MQKYNKQSSTQLPEKYLFFALHYQPEETTSPSAGHYVDQLLVIDLMLSALPSDVKLLVKEHPSQFLKINEGTQGRSDTFYDELLGKDNRVQIVPVNADSRSIMRRSMGVITLTGTIGIEAVANDIPVLVFGRSWYEGAPNVFRINNKQELDVAIKEILTPDRKKLKDNELTDWTAKRSKSLVFGTPCGSYFQRSKRTKEESAENLQMAISKYLRTKII